jgi:hypothetical protein
MKREKKSEENLIKAVPSEEEPSSLEEAGDSESNRITYHEGNGSGTLDYFVGING